MLKNYCDVFLNSFNGTIFAYGQTSSGKTYTIEGISRKFSDRGLIPRAISAVFREVENRCGQGRGGEGEGEGMERQDITVHVSYMEIYQDVGYDLLNAGMRPGALMVTLPKVNQLFVVCSFICSLFSPFICLFVLSFIRLFVRSFVRSFIPPIPH